MEKIEVFAFDLGGVLAYQDLSVLSKEELLLLKVFMNRFINPNDELLERAMKRIKDIYVKIHRLNIDTLPTLEYLCSSGIRPSIWTNNIREIEPWLDEVGVFRYVNQRDLINSIDIGYDKPSFSFYYQALDILSVSQDRVMFFDDNPINVISARKCGIKSLKYDMSKSLKMEVSKNVRRYQ